MRIVTARSPSLQLAVSPFPVFFLSEASGARPMQSIHHVSKFFVAGGLFEDGGPDRFHVCLLACRTSPFSLPSGSRGRSRPPSAVRPGRTREKTDGKTVRCRVLSVAICFAHRAFLSHLRRLASRRSVFPQLVEYCSKMVLFLFFANLLLNETSLNEGPADSTRT